MGLRCPPLYPTIPHIAPYLSNSECVSSTPPHRQGEMPHKRPRQPRGVVSRNKKRGDPFWVTPLCGSECYSSKRRRKRSSIRLVNDPPEPFARRCRPPEAGRSPVFDIRRGPVIAKTTPPNITRNPTTDRI